MAGICILNEVDVIQLEEGLRMKIGFLVINSKDKANRAGLVSKAEALAGDEIPKTNISGVWIKKRKSYTSIHAFYSKLLE